MSTKGILINYQYCTGCMSCEVACKKEHDLPKGKFGIKLADLGPWQIEGKKWEWDHIPMPSDFCNLCEHRTSKGEEPSCVLHCLGGCIEVGDVDDLAKIAKENGRKTVLFVP
ncbi:oxidoreductase [Actinomycetota bacterium]|nr:oxidoreductase [Actinomycetota bacterium]